LATLRMLSRVDFAVAVVGVTAAAEEGMVAIVS
jgi:hypothetical protein